MKKYDSYKDSGIEWVGKIPEHWDESKIKYLSKEPNSLFIDGDWIESNVIVEEGIRYITTGNIKVGYYSEQGSGFISEETFAELNCTEVFEGDLVISRLNSPIGRACIIPNLNNRIVTSVDNVIFRPDSNVNKFYLLYLFSSKEYFEITDLISRGATMQRISRGLYGNIKIPLPSIEEQNAIAIYLKHKTTQIDTLISKKEQFISLLQEERIAIINQAVTKGLDSKVKMKDSGIEWLGEIPEHWKNYRIDWITNIVRGNTGFKKDELLNIGDYVALQYGKTYKVDVVDESFNFFVNSEFFKDSQIVSKGDTILISTSETIEDLGHTCYYNNENIGLLGGEQILLKPNRKFLHEKFLYQYARQFHLELKRYAKGLKVFRFSTHDLKQIFIAIPSIEEQIKIADFLDHETVRIDSLTSKMEKEIELLKEYRTSLISEVITGKIDVRNELLN